MNENTIFSEIGRYYEDLNRGSGIYVERVIIDPFFDEVTLDTNEGVFTINFSDFLAYKQAQKLDREEIKRKIKAQSKGRKSK